MGGQTRLFATGWAEVDPCGRRQCQHVTPVRGVGRQGIGSGAIRGRVEERELLLALRTRPQAPGRLTLVAGDAVHRVRVVEGRQITAIVTHGASEVLCEGSGVIQDLLERDTVVVEIAVDVGELLLEVRFVALAPRIPGIDGREL